MNDIKKQKLYDDDYIWYYCENPQLGMRSALEAAGHPNATRQSAFQIHRRLRDQINNRLTEMMQDSTVFGFHVLQELADKGDTDSVKLQAAKGLLDYGGRSVKHHVVVESAKSDVELDLEIAELQKELSAIDTVEGEFVEVVEPEKVITRYELVTCPLTGNTTKSPIYGDEE